MSDVLARYDDDLYQWSQQQAAALRQAAAQGVNLPLDWENIAEEIESLGKRDRAAVVSRLTTMIVHLLKLEHSIQTDPRRGWIVTVQRTRRSVAKLLAQNPSLHARLPELVVEGCEAAMRDAVAALEEAGEFEAGHLIERTGIDYTPEQLMDDWIPPGPLDP